ncbi:pyrimidine reductase family protein [Actinomadura sp. 7K507]|uniref:pyrimidine reductase family protein n=1 Tax=Actinomadura sp. 7K507 TaxID=2530365 RepID=UPI0010480EA1|nr:pyrimidine reductase family protein [Actinomadura sp. 7K507]TDC75035.1 pyrimidine reductase family protein [Actinomadura sp. 7K507]
MRILSPEAGDVDLVERYAYPPDGAWMRANMVASLDGAAQRDERSGGLGNPADQHLFLLLRGLADVVVVGANTVRAEGYGPVKPSGGWDGVRDGRSPVPPLAIVSRTLDLDFDAPIFAEAKARTIVLTTTTSDPARLETARERADVIVAGKDSLDFPAAVKELEARGHRRLLCEGGPGVLAQVVAAGLLDELCLTLSPLLLAGHPTRILDGAPVPVPPELTLAHAMEDENFLFLRYTRSR